MHSQITGVDFTGVLYVQDSNGEKDLHLFINTQDIQLKVVMDLTVEIYMLAL